MKVVVFDIFGDYGHFRKFYTTSSPLTFSFPPPPTICGILGAMLGIDKNEYLSILGKTKIAIQIMKPIKKIRMGINLINTKDNCWTLIKWKTHEPRTQILTEYVKDPHYRIFVANSDSNILKSLCDKIKEHKTFYTISLGLSELLADFSFISYLNAEEKQNQIVEISTVVPFNFIQTNGLIPEPGRKFVKEKIPVEMDTDRIVQRYEDVLFDIDGKSLKLNLKTYWQLEDGTKITFI